MIESILADPNVQNVLLGVTSNALTRFVSMSARGTLQLVSENGPESPANVEKLLKSAIDQTSESFPWTGPAKIEEICLFVVSPETGNIIQQIFSTQLLGWERASIGQVEEEFIVCLARFVDVSREAIAGHARALFRSLVKSCDAALRRASDEGFLAAHETLSALRHNILLDEIASVKKNAVLLTHQKISTREIIEFEAKYRGQVHSRHANITPPDFDAQRRVPIDELYVAPHLTRLAREKDEANHSLTVEGLQVVLKRGVLLGNPGGGKSTLAQKFVHDLTTREIRPARATPILVILRDYAAAKKEKGYSLLQFIEATANATYQVNAPPGGFEYMLLNGRALVVLDGLDELLDTTHRQEIAGDIESFCNLFPSTRVLVTSRQVGYEQATLDSQRFDTFLLEAFNDDQVQEYVGKWFALDDDLTAEQQKSKAISFFNESRIVADLCATPLMLALMCSIYRGENYIPTNRPDVYEKCALMLFDRWDKGRGIRISLPIDAHIRPAMMHLAYWIYSHEALQSGVTERKLVSKTTEYLCPKRFEDEDEAAAAARDFIAFCRGRAWVFTDTGTTREGERLYQFTHRTFLEYFTASQLVRVNPTPDRLLLVLLPRIAKREWDVVAQLAFQIQNKNVEGAGDELLNKLKEVAVSNRVEPWNYLSFAARCLEFIIPAPRTCREITQLSLDLYLRQPIRPDETWTAMSGEEPRETIAALMSAAPENQKVITAAFEADLIERINSSDDIEAAKAFEFAAHITICLHTRRRRVDGSIEVQWREFSKRIMHTCAERLKELSMRDFRTAVDGFWRGLWPISYVLEHHGSRGLFRRSAFRVFPTATSGAIAEWLLMQVLCPALREHDCDRYATLVEIGRWLIRVEKPIVRGMTLSVESIVRPYLTREISELEPRVENTELFPVFALLTIFIERESDWREQLSSLSRFNHILFDRLMPLFVLRFSNSTELQVREALRELTFESGQEQFAIDWCTRHTSLFEPK